MDYSVNVRAILASFYIGTGGLVNVTPCLAFTAVCESCIGGRSVKTIGTFMFDLVFASLLLLFLDFSGACWFLSVLGMACGL